MTNNILEPLTLSSGSHKAGSGKGCAMNVISWENGDSKITDFPSCSDPLLSRMVQLVNDLFADPITGLLDSDASMRVLALGHATVGTAYHSFDELGLARVYLMLDEVIRTELRAKSHLAILPIDPGRMVKIDYSPTLLNDEYLTAVKHNVTQRFITYVNLIVPLLNQYICSDVSPGRDAFVDITSTLINRFKRLTNVADVVTPVEKTKAAVEKMMERV